MAMNISSKILVPVLIIPIIKPCTQRLLVHISQLLLEFAVQINFELA